MSTWGYKCVLWCWFCLSRVNTGNKWKIIISRGQLLISRQSCQQASVFFSLILFQDYPCVVVVGLGKKDIQSDSETSEEKESCSNYRQASGGELSVITCMVALETKTFHCKSFNTPIKFAFFQTWGSLKPNW